MRFNARSSHHFTETSLDVELMRATRLTPSSHHRREYCRHRDGCEGHLCSRSCCAARRELALLQCVRPDAPSELFGQHRRPDRPVEQHRHAFCMRSAMRMGAAREAFCMRSAMRMGSGTRGDHPVSVWIEDVRATIQSQGQAGAISLLVETILFWLCFLFPSSVLRLLEPSGTGVVGT